MVGRMGLLLIRMLVVQFPDSCSLHIKVSLGKTLNPKLLTVAIQWDCECVCICVPNEQAGTLCM